MIAVTAYSEEPFLLAGVEALLAGSDKFRVAGTCQSMEQVHSHLTDEHSRVALLDLTAAVTLAGLRELRMLCPQTAVVLWVHRVACEFATQAIAAGVRGILSRSRPIGQQLECLERVAAGELCIESCLCREMLAVQQVPLTRREQQLVRLLAQGLKNKELAYALGITEGTVKIYLSRLFTKVGCKDRFELALFALRNYSSEQLGVKPPTQAWPEANIADATAFHPFALQMLVTPGLKCATAGPRSGPRVH